MASYQNPSARLGINGRLSEAVSIGRGTRQGCPLFPLFALSLEPLAQTIRDLSLVKGIGTGTLEQKVTLFADDVVMTLSDPVSSLLEVITILARFYSIAGFKLNWGKSWLLPIQGEVCTIKAVAKTMGIKLAGDWIMYLGVYITNRYSTLYSANYSRLISSLITDLTKWQKLSISWLGRVTSVKMNILPRLIYVFQALPTQILLQVIRWIQSLIFKFTWAGGRPRVARKLMLMSKQLVGRGSRTFFIIIGLHS